MGTMGRVFSFFITALTGIALAGAPPCSRLFSFSFSHHFIALFSNAQGESIKELEFQLDPNATLLDTAVDENSTFPRVAALYSLEQKFYVTVFERESLDSSVISKEVFSSHTNTLGIEFLADGSLFVDQKIASGLRYQVFVRR